MRDKETALVIAIEECSEVIQAITKIKRFTVDSYHPADPGTSNLAHLIQEMGDVMAIFEILRDETDLGITQDALDLAKAKKHEKLLRKYLPRI